MTWVWAFVLGWLKRAEGLQRTSSLAFAELYGELTIDYVKKGDDANAAIVASRAFHHAEAYRRERT